MASPMPPFRVRSFRPEDQGACKALYVDGLIGGSIAENDTGMDIDDIDAAYMRPDACQFWVAEAPCSEGGNGGDNHAWTVVGMIGVQAYEQGVGEIRRLRVAPSHRRRGIGAALMEAAVRYCQEHGYLKIKLDTFMQREPAIRLFEKFRFRHEHTRRLGEKELMYFYLDLYTGDEHRHEPGDPRHAS